MPPPNMGELKPDQLSYRQCLEHIRREVKRRESYLPAEPPADAKVDPADWAFILYTTTYLFCDGNLDVQQFRDWLTEGFDDQQIDLVAAFLDGTSLRIYVVQFKNVNSFSDSTLKDIDSGLSYLFEVRAETYQALNNTRLKNKIPEVRKLVGQSNDVELHVLYITRCQTHGKKLPEQVERERKRIAEKWSKKPSISRATVELLGPQDLVAYQLAAKFRIPNKRLSLNISPGPSHETTALEYRSPATKQRAFVVTVAASRLTQLIKDNEEWIFQENLRVYLGGRKESINETIYRSCTDTETAELFWLLNNGITITCREVRYHPDPDNPEIVLDSPQIVNGCQTSMTLKDALDKGSLQPNTYLLVRIVETQDAGLVDKVTTATNRQTAIKSRDLRSNDSIQRTLRMAFENLGRYYETKAGEYRVLKSEERKKIIPNDKCGQASLAVFFRKPSIAMTRKSAIWEDSDPRYELIFSKSAEELLYSFELYRYCIEQRKQSMKVRRAKSTKARSTLSQSVILYGVFHLARIMSYHLVGDGIQPLDKLEQMASEITSSSSKVKKAYRQARKELKDVLRSRKTQRGAKFVSFWNELRSSEIDEAIDRHLHQSHP